jgi:broad specificity phosphatase PhoE
MKTIYLIRHTEYELFNGLTINPGLLPVTLSDVGLQQAARLHEYFADKQIEQIFSSPVHRCVQTSEIISAGKIAITKDKRLKEVFSAAQGSIVADNWRLQLYEHVDTLGGEAPQDIQTRVAEFWEEVVVPFESDCIVCSHGDPLLFLYEYLRGRKASTDLSVNKPDGYVDRGSVRKVTMDRREVVQIGEALKNQDLV